MLWEGRRDEQSSLQAKETESKEHIGNSVGTNKLQTKVKGRNLKCFSCGGAFPHEGVCPAKGKYCRNCNQKNHFASVCKNKQHRKKERISPKKTLHPLKQENLSSYEDEYLYVINSTHSKGETQSPRVGACFDGYRLTMLLETGASINFIDKSTHSKMEKAHYKKGFKSYTPFNRKSRLIG